jgi:hypothetical protein
MERVRNNVSGLERLAKIIAVPADFPAHRMPTFPALERTAVLGFTDTSTTFVSPGSTTAYVLCRDPAYPFWSNRTVSLPASQFGLAVSYNTAVAGAANEQITIPIGDVTPQFTGGAGASSLDPLTTPPFRRNGNVYFNLGGQHNTTQFNCAVSMTVPSGGPNKVAVRGTYLDGTFNEVIWDVSNLIPTPVSGRQFVIFALPADAIGYRISELVVTTSATGITFSEIAIGISTNSGAANDPLYSPLAPVAAITRIMPTGPPPEVSTAALIWQNTRATASAVLLTNVTSVMNKEGTISAARAACSSFPVFSSFQWNGFVNIHPKDRYFGALENGLYTFTLPDINGETFRDCLISPEGLTFAGVVELDQMQYCTAILASDLDATGSVGTSLATTVARHIEFRTTSRLFPTGFAKEPLETYHTAQMALVSMGTIMENPTHMTQIAKMVTGAVRAFWPVAKPIVYQAGVKLVKAATTKIAGDMRQAKLQKEAPRTKVVATRKRNGRKKRT